MHAAEFDRDDIVTDPIFSSRASGCYIQGSGAVSGHGAPTFKFVEACALGCPMFLDGEDDRSIRVFADIQTTVRRSLSGGVGGDGEATDYY